MSSETSFSLKRISAVADYVLKKKDMFQKLSNRVKYFKESQEGVTEMCQLVEEYVEKKVKEEAIKTAMNLLKNGVSVELIAKCMPSLSVDLIKELQKQLV